MKSTTTILAAIIILIMASASMVNASEIVNYQGRLTDDTGEPVVNGNYSLTFTIWDDSTGGSMLWSEIHGAVSVTDGLFSVNLGKDGALEASIFETEPLFLRIQVNDEIISPRMRLTSAPTAITAKKVAGDIETGEGSLNLNSSGGTLAFRMTAQERIGTNFRMYNISPSYPDQLQLDLSTDDYGGHLELFPTGEIQFDPGIRMGFDPTPFRSPYFTIYEPSSGFPESPFLKMGVEPTPFRGYLEMYDAGSGMIDYPLLRMGVEPSPFHQSYIAMYNPEIGPPPKLMEMRVDDSTGEWISSFSLYDYVTHLPEPCKVFEISHSPTNGASFKMATPLPEPPRVYFEVNVEQAAGPSLNFYDDIGQVMGIDPSPFNEAFSMYFKDPGDDGKLLEIMANHVTEESSIRMIDPGDDERSLIEMNSGNSGPSIYMFNPQPEPPAKLFNLSAILGVKSSDDIVMELTSADSLYQTKLTPGRVKVGHSNNDDYPRGEINAGADSVTFFMQGLSIGTPAPAIGMLSSSNEAKMGIGTLTPNENLVVGDDLGAYSGTRIAVGGDNAGTSTGFIFGESSTYRGWMLWDVDDNLIELGTKEGAPNYGSTMILKSGTVGIGGTSAGDALHVYGDICYTGSIGSCSDVRYKKDIRTLGNALDRVSRLRGVSFNWKKDEYPQQRFSDESQVGLIAQEVKEVFPDVVSEDNDGYYNVDYTKLTPLLIEAIKELKQENDELKKRIEKLENY